MRSPLPLVALSLILGSCRFDPSGVPASDLALDFGTPEQAPLTCGDGVRLGSEACDGSDLGGQTCADLGFDRGTLACTTSCKLDITGCVAAACGNGVVETDEQCDGLELQGRDCISLGHLGGTLGCGLDCAFDASGCFKMPQDWLHQDFGYRKALTIDHTQVEVDLVQFPVLIRLKDADIAAKAQPDGDDLVFTAADGTTRLPHEVELHDPTGPKQVAWVGLPALSASQDTTIYLYYGNLGCASQQTPAQVWDPGHAGVWHLNEQVADEATAGVHLDSTANGRNGAQNNNNDTLGKIADGQQFDGSGDYIEISSPGAFVLGDADCTVSAWIRTTSSTDRGILIKADAANHESGDKLFGVNHSSDRLGIDHGWVTYLAGVTDINDGNWHHVAWVQQRDVNGAAEQWDLYVDGTHESSKSATTKPDIPGHTLRIGGRCQSSCFSNRFSGRIDEVRISSVPRGAGWLMTSFRNQNSPGKFVSVGAEQSLLPPP